jgi:hypothetical protein
MDMALQSLRSKNRNTINDLAADRIARLFSEKKKLVFGIATRKFLNGEISFEDIFNKANAMLEEYLSTAKIKGKDHYKEVHYSNLYDYINLIKNGKWHAAEKIADVGATSFWDYIGL